MNFYDEAIEAKYFYLNQLIRQQRDMREMIKRGQLEVIESNVNLEHLYEPNMNALRQAEPYFWDTRIVQLVIASGEQLPETITFDDSWLNGRAGYWWLGRSSPLIGVSSSDGERKWYVYSLLWWLDSDGTLHVTTLDIFEKEHNQLGAFTWRIGETLQDALIRLRDTPMISRASCRTDLILDKIIIDKTKEIVELENRRVEVVRQAKQKNEEIKELGGEVHEVDLNNALTRREEAIRVADEYNTGHQGRTAMWKEASANALRAFACGSLWLQQKIVVTEYGRLDRHAERRLARASMETNVRVVHLRSKSYVKTTTDEEKHQVDWAWQWAVRGHWREQPTKEGMKLIWIHPYIKGPEDKPLKPDAGRVFAVTR